MPAAMRGADALFVVVLMLGLMWLLGIVVWLLAAASQ